MSVFRQPSSPRPGRGYLAGIIAIGVLLIAALGLLAIDRAMRASAFDEAENAAQNEAAILAAGLESELDKESKRRDEALKLQKDLTKAQIRMMEAQTDAINNGDGLIKVYGAGLQPHLEAFMWEILKAIQVRVNADGLKMLLGT